jgi:CDP-diacylglycerol--serine O-phosphatidyltransferase
MASTLLSIDDFQRILLLALPLVIGGILHMIVVKTDILSYFKKPIHHRWFGVNKTWRGFLIMPLATWPGVFIAQSIEKLLDLSTPLFVGSSTLVLAFILGTAYCLAELPNSYLKRRLGIKEGMTADKHKIFFIILDQADSAFGCLIAYKLYLSIPWNIFWGTIVFGTVIHLFLNVLLYGLKIRKNPF